MSGWIVPVKDSTTTYPLNSNTFYITTESVTGGRAIVGIFLFTDSGASITWILWTFTDWGYIIGYCTPRNYSSEFTFPVSPPIGVKKTWEITLTTEDLKIKCNSIQVLHFIFNNKHNDRCTSKVKGKIPTRILFWGNDTATKKLNADQVGK